VTGAPDELDPSGPGGGGPHALVTGVLAADRTSGASVTIARGPGSRPASGEAEAAGGPELLYREGIPGLAPRVPAVDAFLSRAARRPANTLAGGWDLCLGGVVALELV